MMLLKWVGFEQAERRCCSLLLSPSIPTSTEGKLRDVIRSESRFAG
jgi:hypothetical protein